MEDKPSNDSPYADLDALYLDAIAVFPDADTVRLTLGVVYCLSVPMSVPALHELLDRQDVDARIVIPALGLLPWSPLSPILSQVSDNLSYFKCY